MKKIISISLFLLSVTAMFSQTDSVFVSTVKFNNPVFDNSHAGSGFFLSYKGSVYGVTAKHVLFFAKTDGMNTISFNGQLKSWSFTSKYNSKRDFRLGKLINENPNEKLEMPPKGDWLIFKTNHSISKNSVVYSLRDTPLKINEIVSFLGIPYKNKKAIRITGRFIGFTKEGNLRLDVPKGTYNGCSGGPVIDSAGKIVGIVSMGYYNNKTKKMVFEPASTNYFKNTIENQ